MDHCLVIVCGRLADKIIFTVGKKEDHSDDRAWGRIAVNKKKLDGSKKVNYHVFVAWGKVARVLRDYTDTGKQVTLHGELQTNNKLLPDGKYNNYTEIMVEKVFLGTDSQKNRQVEEAVSAPPPAAISRGANVALNSMQLQALAAAVKATLNSRKQ